MHFTHNANVQSRYGGKPEHPAVRPVHPARKADSAPVHRQKSVASLILPGEGGIRLQIRVTERNGAEAALQIAVKDSGIGVKSEDMEKLFQQQKLEQKVDIVLHGIMQIVSQCQQIMW